MAGDEWAWVRVKLKMAVLYKIPEHSRTGVITAFVYNDLMLMAMAEDLGSVITPGDEYRTKPYMLTTHQPCRREDITPPPIQCLTFSAYKTRSPHDRAVTKIGVFGRVFEGPHDVEDGRIFKKPIHTTKFDQGGPCTEMTIEMEDEAFRATCHALGLDESLDGWRAERLETRTKLAEKLGLQDAPFVDLPHWDEDQRKMDAFQAAKIERYRPVLAKFKDAIPTDGGCVCVFGTNPFGDQVEYQCPYDRVGETPFCSACTAMNDIITP